MKYIVLDLEWNQSNTKDEKRNALLPFEIIEIGAVKLNEKMEIIDHFTQLIKPKVYKEMHHITGKLVHLNMKELERGKDFNKVMEEFLLWCGEEYLFCTWGPLDLLELQRNMKFYNMKALSEKTIKFYDIQKLYFLEYKENIRRSLEYAVDYLKVEKEIPFHRAHSDAFYTAKVFYNLGKNKKLLEKFSYDTYILPQTKKEEIHVVFEDYTKHISREFVDKKELLADREIISTKCHICHKNIKKKVKWFSTNGKHYYSISCCNVHGNMKSKIRIRKTENNTVYAVKTNKFIRDDEVVNLLKKRDKLKELKKVKK